MTSWREVLQSQGGVAAYDQLLERGLSRRHLSVLIAEGLLVREGRWLLVDTHRQDGTDPDGEWKRRLYSALLCRSVTKRKGMVAFRRTAATLWGLDGATRDIIEFAVVSGRSEPGPGAVHIVRPFCPGDLAELDGLAITSVTRTLLDLGQVVGADVIERATESALRHSHVTVGSLDRALQSLPNLSWTYALRGFLRNRPPGLTPTESDAETLFVQLARNAGLPEPRRQFHVPTADGLLRLDFAWPTSRLAVEIDGAAVHATREALARDLRRQNRLMLSLTAASWALLRFSWEDVAVERHASQTLSRLREAWALGLSGRRGLVTA
jgi:very-short-patch-repair endonuclease